MSEGPKEIVVFMIRKPAKCAECGAELFPGQFLRMESERPLCMGCADLGHLEFLPRGDVAVAAHVRHVHTEYDQLLSGGEDRELARSRVRHAVDEILRRWEHISPTWDIQFSI